MVTTLVVVHCHEPMKHNLKKKIIYMYILALSGLDEAIFLNTFLSPLDLNPPKTLGRRLRNPGHVPEDENPEISSYPVEEIPFFHSITSF